MKTVRTVVFLGVLLSFVLATPAIGGWYKILGRSIDPIERTEAEYVLMVRLIDKETHMPVKGANIVLYEKGMPLATLTTDKSGLGVVLIGRTTYIPSRNDNSWKVKVTSKRYSYWETELRQNDFYRIQPIKMIHLPNQEYIKNADGTTRVTDQMLLSALKSGKYELYDYSHYSGYLPALLELTVEMEKVNREQDSRRDDHRRRPDREDREDREDQEDRQDSRYNESDELFFARLILQAEGEYKADRAADRATFIAAMNNKDGFPNWRELPWQGIAFKGPEHGESEGYYFFCIEEDIIIIHVEPGPRDAHEIVEWLESLIERSPKICQHIGYRRCVGSRILEAGENNFSTIRCGSREDR